MFAIFLTEAMDPFYKNIISFPTIVFTFLLLFCVFYWMLAVLGVVDLDFLDLDLPDTDGGDINVNDAVSGAGVLGGLILRLGLNGVPLPIVISLLSLFGWLICFILGDFIFPYVSGWFLQFLIGVPILFVASYVSALITGFIIRPMRPIFKAMNQEVQVEIVGKIGVVRTSRADGSFGEATVADGGAGLIVKIRSYGDEKYLRGDRVALLEYDTDQGIYKVISENEFNNELKIKD